MVTIIDKSKGWDNIRIKIETKRKIMQLKLNWDMNTYDAVINRLLNKK